MPETIPLIAGEVLHGKYRIEEVIGRGAMGTVVSAWHIGLDQRVAIKMLHSHIIDADKSVRARFQREARAAAKIHSEHVCRVLDTGKLEDGTPFLVMEFMEGSDLEVELTSRGRFTVGEASQAVFQACDALKKAHAAGIVHRDLKPANLFLAQRPDGSTLIKILDFGVSKSLTGTNAGVDSATAGLKLTGTAMMIGSPIYMSPEQLNSSKDVDGRTDLWALGAILYELTTGQTPFCGESMPQLVSAVIHQEPIPLAEHGVEAPDGFEALIMRALCKDREDRIASAGELAKALIPFCRTQPGFRSGMVPSIMPEPGSAPLSGKPQNDHTQSMATRATMPSMPATDHSIAAATEQGTDRKRWFVVAAVAAITAAVALALVLRAKPDASSRNPRTAASSPATNGASAETKSTKTEPTTTKSTKTEPTTTKVDSPSANAELEVALPAGLVAPQALEPDDSQAVNDTSDDTPNDAPATATAPLTVDSAKDDLEPDLEPTGSPNVLAPSIKPGSKTSAADKRATRKKKRTQRVKRSADKSVNAPSNPVPPPSGTHVPNFGGRR